MKLSHYITASLILSLLFHLLIMLTISKVAFTPPVPILQQTEVAEMPIDLILQDPKPEPEKPKDASKTGKKGGDSDRRSHNELMKKPVVDPLVERALQENRLSPTMPRPTIRFKGLDKSKLDPQIPKQITEVKLEAPRPKILEIDASRLPKSLRTSRSLTPKVERIDVSTVQLPSLQTPGPVITGIGAIHDVGLRITPPTLGGPGNIPGDDTTDDIPKGFDSKDITLVKGDGSLPKSKEGPVVPFDDFVDILVLVKEDHVSGGGYFMASIKANERSDSVKEIPKDIILILDRSTSISPQKFKAFKAAAAQSLEYLNPSDSFNVVTFTNKAESLAPAASCLPATPANRAKGKSFIQHLTKGGTTSVFDGLAPFVKSAGNSTQKPLNIFMLTDGISTVNIFKDEDFLKTITDFNPGRVSIFPFCAGQNANRDLLDFLGFLNRGQSLHAPAIEDINEHLTNYITDHSSLLVRDIEYLTIPSLVENIYPKKLQHLYRGSDVQIFGRYGAADTEIMITIVGYDYNNVRRDVMFRRKISDCSHTDEDIDKGWAAKKIIQLLADKTLSDSPDKKKAIEYEINKTSRYFNLAVPY